MVSKLPSRLRVVTLAICLDGGSFTLYCVDDIGEPYVVHLMQRLCGDALRRQFGLFFDGEPVPRDSQIERDLGNLLRAAEVVDRENGTESNCDITLFVRDVISYIETPHLDATRR